MFAKIYIGENILHNLFASPNGFKLFRTNLFNIRNSKR